MPKLVQTCSFQRTPCSKEAFNKKSMNVKLGVENLVSFENSQFYAKLVRFSISGFNITKSHKQKVVCTQSLNLKRWL